MIKTVNLLCNLQINPIGLDDLHPGFSWQMISEESGQFQTGYRIIVYTKSRYEKLVWDSGWVKSEECLDIQYQGEALSSRNRYYWKVCQMDVNGESGEWSEEAFFETGLMGIYHGQWIGSVGNRVTKAQSAPMFRKSFNLPEGIIRGRIYICGLGYHVLYVNGKRMGDGILNPGVSQYDKTVYYETIDVTEQICVGENVIGAVLGSGWYNSDTDEPWGFKYASWKSQQKLWLEGYFELENGQEIVLLSDASWKYSFGPYRAEQLRNGECYDARLEKTGWREPGYDDKDFVFVQIKRTPGGVLKSQQFVPIRRVETLKPVQIREVRPGVWVYDFGKNITGFVRIHAKGYRDSEITFKYSERVNSDGNINRDKIDTYIYSGEFQTDHYIMKGAEIECWTPEFTYHGFRYLEITGYPGDYTPDAFQADVVYTDLPRKGEFKCSNQLINAIQQAVVQASLTNFHGIPTDCPHREKNGWLCDAWLNSENMLTNFDPRTLYRKWMVDIVDAQRPDGHLPGLVPTVSWGYNRSGPMWGVAIIMIPWYQYLHTGDKRILKDNYSAMQKFFENLQLMENEGIIAVDGETDYAFGDWLPPGGNCNRKCPVALSETATYFHAASLLAKIARVLGDKEYIKIYQDKAIYIRECFRKAFFTNDENLMLNQSQTGWATVLFSELQETQETSVFVEALVKEVYKYNLHFDTGFQGTKFIVHALQDNDRQDLLYKILNMKEYPGFGYMIEQGATTLWEDWEGEMSQNHSAYGDISTFFYQGLAGIRVNSSYPGYKKFLLKPFAPDGLDWVEAWHDCPYGRIESSWYRNADKIVYRCMIPANTEAALVLFDGSRKTLKSGKYEFVVKEL